MHGPDGRDYKNRINFMQIIPREKLVYSNRGEGETEHIQFHVNVTFVEKAGRTTVTMQTVFPTQQLRDHVVDNFGAKEGGLQHMARLADQLPRLSEPQAVLPEKAFVFTRELDARRALVWKAWTQRDHLAQWWGPKGMKLEVISADVRPGGKFHYSMQPPGGAKMWGLFVYRELNPEHRIVWVNSFADEQGVISRAPYSPLIPLEMQNTVLLQDRGQKTLLTLRSAPINATPQEREFFEGMFKSMEGGFGGTFDQLQHWLQHGAAS